MRKFITFFICVGILFSFAICHVDIVNAKNNSSKCNLAGTWRVGDGFATFVPLDPTGRRFSVLVDSPLPEDPPFMDIHYPEAAAISPTRGIAIKVSNNLYKFTLSKIILDEGRNIIGEVELSGKTKFIDCDYRVLVYRVKFLKLFDGFWSQIGCSVPITAYTERYEIDEPCDELPDFPQ